MNEHLLGRLAVLELRVRAAVARRRAGDVDPDDGFRGLYLTDHQVDGLLAARGARLLDDDPAAALLASVEQTAAPDSRLRQLAAAFDLQNLDLEILLVAAYPDLDARAEKLYGYLHDDVTQKRATTGLALELAGQDPTSAAARARFEEHAPLVGGGLLVLEATAPYLRRVLRVPDRVVAHLLGSDTPASSLRDVLDELMHPQPPDPVARALGGVLSGQARLSYLREATGSDGIRTAVEALRVAGLSAVVLDLRRLDGDADAALALARRAGREALLTGSGLVLGPVERLEALGTRVVRAFAELLCTTIVHGSRTWDPSWSRDVAVLADAPVLEPAERARLWTAALDGQFVDGLDPVRATSQFRLDGTQVRRAATAARHQAAFKSCAVGVPELMLGARSQNAVGLERLARRIVPEAGWDSLVLPATTRRQLEELAARARNRDTVLDTWQMRPGGGRGRGVAALFAGDSGTGKTLSAEVIAGVLGLDLYTVDLATVVDKYIGETEKNLERIFGEADNVNGVLLFDEADALFGKRSDVKDARDRYANVEVAYLLQRMESFNGLAVLSTNLRTNLDEAFARRLDAIIDFPNPDVVARRALWELCLGHRLPRADDIDLAFLASSFDLSGGNIRSITLTAAYGAANRDGPVAMADLVAATQMEYRKLGRLLLEAEFGSWLDVSGRLQPQAIG